MRADRAQLHIPHALAGNIVFQKGDVLVTGASAPIWGHFELERTMVIGEPTLEQERLFGHMKAVQEVAFEAIAWRALLRRRYGRPGPLQQVTSSPIGAITRAMRSGLYHEGPFLDSGDHTEIRVKVTVEPGLYAPELGGFRHRTPSSSRRTGSRSRRTTRATSPA